jgi:hypothetical protein
VGDLAAAGAKAQAHHCAVVQAIGTQSRGLNWLT